MLPTKIVIFDPGDYSNPSARANRIIALARGLAEEGVSTSVVVAIPPNTKMTADSRYKAINFVGTLPFSSRGTGLLHKTYSRILSFINTLKWISKTCDNSAKQVALMFDEDFFQSFGILLWLRYHHYTIIHERGEHPLLYLSAINRITKALYLWVYLPRIDRMLVISSHLKTYFAEHLSRMGKPKQIDVLNMMVEPDRFVPSETDNKDMVINENPMDVVYIGTMYGDKDGVDILINSFNEVKGDFPKARLVLIGENVKQEWMGKINLALDTEEKKERVVLTGRQSREAVEYYLKGAYALALARPDNIQAKYGFPTKLGEYLATGKPVVITSVGDIPLFLRDGDNAFVAEPSSIKSFADKLKECLSDPRKAEEIGSKGRELVYSVFNYRECAKDLLKTL